MLILLAPLIFFALIRVGFFNFQIINEWLIQLQNLCAQGYARSEHHEILSAMVCGKPPVTRQILTDWSTTGLLPVLIGAGTHFIFFERFLNRLLKNHPTLLKTSLFLFVCVTGFSPALTRGLVTQLISDFNARWKLGLRFPQIWLFSLIFCLGFCPQWMTSLGFIISAQCGLLMYLSYRIFQKNKKRKVTMMNLKFYVLRVVLFTIGLMPLFRILGLPVLHPFTLIIQSIGIPIAGLILFPIGMSERIFTALQPFCDELWNWVQLWIHHEAQALPPLMNPSHHFFSQVHYVLGWNLVGGFFALVFLLDFKRKTKLSSQDILVPSRF